MHPPTAAAAAMAPRAPRGGPRCEGLGSASSSASIEHSMRRTGAPVRGSSGWVSSRAPIKGVVRIDTRDDATPLGFPRAVSVLYGSVAPQQVIAPSPSTPQVNHIPASICTKCPAGVASSCRRSSFPQHVTPLSARRPQVCFDPTVSALNCRSRAPRTRCRWHLDAGRCAHRRTRHRRHLGRETRGRRVRRRTRGSTDASARRQARKGFTIRTPAIVCPWFRSSV
jgi:hypothetical protein